jgi:MipA family protein
VGFQVNPAYLSSSVISRVLAVLILALMQARADESPDSNFRAAVGPGIFKEPRYPGSPQQRIIYFPFLDAEFHGRLYSSASDVLGVYGIKTTTTQAGAAIEYDLNERLSRDDARLRGFPDVRQTPRIKLFASHTIFIFTGDINVASDISGRGEGTVGQANLWLTIPLNREFSVNLGPGLTIGDSHYMHSYFSVSRSEAANSGLSPYLARAGTLDAHLNGLAEWTVATHYRIGMQVCLSRLQHEAAESPVAVQIGQRTLTAWLAYQFR